MLGLHPRLTGLRDIFNDGRLAIVQRTGYPNSSRSHFQGFDIWGTANPASPTGNGWLGRYLDTLPSPVDPLAGVEQLARDAARAVREQRRGAGDSGCAHLQLREPEQRRRSGSTSARPRLGWPRTGRRIGRISRS